MGLSPCDKNILIYREGGWGATYGPSFYSDGLFPFLLSGLPHSLQVSLVSIKKKKTKLKFPPEQSI